MVFPFADFPPAAARRQGISSAPTPTMIASNTSATTAVPMMPARISVGKLRLNPSVKKYPSPCTPTREPTDTRDTVDADTTRNPPRRTGPANGNSTASTRRHAG